MRVKTGLLILPAAQHDTSAMVSYRLLIGAVLMLAFGYRGQASFLPARDGLGLGLCG